MLAIARTFSVALLGAALCLGCTVGDVDAFPPDDSDAPNDPDNPNDSENQNDPEPVVQDYELSVSPANQALTLGTSTEFTVDLTSSNFAGPVGLSASGYPSTWEVSFSPSDSVVLSENQVTTVTMSVVVPSNAEAATADIDIQTAAALGVRRTAANVAVENLLLIPIEANTGSGTHTFGAVEVRLGATIRIVNYDTTTTHRIHAVDDDAGLPHQPPPGMAQSPGDGIPGGEYTINITSPGQFSYYCHDHDREAGEGAVAVIAAQ